MTDRQSAPRFLSFPDPIISERWFRCRRRRPEGTFGPRGYNRGCRPILGGNLRIIVAHCHDMFSLPHFQAGNFRCRMPSISRSGTASAG